jgi:transcriptional regulator with XRE-family HTH domain
MASSRVDEYLHRCHCTTSHRLGGVDSAQSCSHALTMPVTEKPDPDNVKWVGTEIRTQRVSRRLSRAKAAQLAGIHDRTLERIEAGEYPDGRPYVPDEMSIRAIAEVLGLDLGLMLLRLGYPQDPDVPTERVPLEDRVDRVEELLDQVIERLDRIEPDGGQAE